MHIIMNVAAVVVVCVYTDNTLIQVSEVVRQLVVEYREGNVQWQMILSSV